MFNAFYIIKSYFVEKKSNCSWSEIILNFSYADRKLFILHLQNDICSISILLFQNEVTLVFSYFVK